VLKFHPALAPVKCAILPLLKNNDELTSMARNIFNDLKFSFLCQYDEKDAIGRRYRRQDAIGTPYCVTVDHQCLEDQTVTIRERDTLKQDRIHVSKIRDIVAERIDFRSLFV
jgi:glycyl-tRNA synthetase